MVVICRTINMSVVKNTISVLNIKKIFVIILYATHNVINIKAILQFILKKVIMKSATRPY